MTGLAARSVAQLGCNPAQKFAYPGILERGHASPALQEMAAMIKMLQQDLNNARREVTRHKGGGGGVPMEGSDGVVFDSIACAPPPCPLPPPPTFPARTQQRIPRRSESD